MPADRSDASDLIEVFELFYSFMVIPVMLYRVYSRLASDSREVASMKPVVTGCLRAALLLVLLSAPSVSHATAESLQCLAAKLDKAVRQNTASRAKAINLAGKLQKTVERMGPVAEVQVSRVPLEPARKMESGEFPRAKPSPQRQFEITERTHLPTPLGSSVPQSSLRDEKLRQIHSQAALLQRDLEGGAWGPPIVSTAETISRLAGACHRSE